MDFAALNQRIGGMSVSIPCDCIAMKDSHLPRSHYDYGGVVNFFSVMPNPHTRHILIGISLQLKGKQNRMRREGE